MKCFRAVITHAATGKHLRQLESLFLDVIEVSTKTKTSDFLLAGQLPLMKLPLLRTHGRDGYPDTHSNRPVTFVDPPNQSVHLRHRRS
jgi:hypothetical protein